MFEVYVDRSESVTVYVDTDDEYVARELAEKALCYDEVVQNFAETSGMETEAKEIDPKDIDGYKHILITPVEPIDTLFGGFTAMVVDGEAKQSEDDDEEEDDDE